MIVNYNSVCAPLFFLKASKITSSRSELLLFWSNVFGIVVVKLCLTQHHEWATIIDGWLCTNPHPTMLKINNYCNNPIFPAKTLMQ